MAASHGLQLFAFLLILPGLQSLQTCLESCSCPSDSLLNCSSAGLSSAPLHIDNSITQLDLSNNFLGSLTLHSKYYHLQKVWLGNNSFTHLSLCMGMDMGVQPVSRLRRDLGPLRRWGCLLWAPSLQLLSVERNQLKKLPEGLGQQRSLQILNLSFNKISKLEPREFSHLKQMKELHLQHNLITSLHPETFQKLDKLKVLDLSFNLLTSLHPMTYVSLRNIGADVSLGGNRWLCDCKMRFLQRWMAYDHSRGLKIWSIICDSPFANSGQDLLNLQEDDFQCHNSETNLHHDITAYSGEEILLTCPEQDATWWTPNGQASKSQAGDLLLSKITEQDAGLYVCVSKSHHKVVTIYNVQIRERTDRKTRSLPDQHRVSLDTLTRAVPSDVTHSHFAMAVSLSVIITFIIAFILGVLARPCICALWAKTKTKKQKSPKTYSPSAVQQGQYNNEAYLHCEDPAEIELAHRERRVTFSDITEEGNMQYYDTVAADLHEANGAAIGSRHSQTSIESSDDSGSEEDSRKRTKQVVATSGRPQTIEHENIPDSIEKEERNSLSSRSSQSSISDHVFLENSSTPKINQRIEERVQQTAITTVVHQISVERTDEIPGFPSEPFSDWSPHVNNSTFMDPDNGEQFEYSDSVRSSSPMSPNESFRHPNVLVSPSNKKVSFGSSSSSSEVSDDEPMHYTVNRDSDEEPEQISQHFKSSSSSSSSDSESESLHAGESWPAVDLVNIPSVKRRLDVKVKAVGEEVGKNKMQVPEQFSPDQKPPTIKKRQAPSPPLPPPRKSLSSSDSEDEQEIKVVKHPQENLQLVTSPNQTSTIQTVHFEEESQFPAIDLVNIPKVKQRLDIKETSQAVDTSSSSDSEDEIVNMKVTKVQERFPSTNINVSKPKSDTSSSSDSEDEREVKPSSNKHATATLEQESKWPVIDLNVTKVKRRLDVKAPQPSADFSSSDSEDEKVNVTQVQEKVPTVDIKVPKPASGTSSSSDSEDERENLYKENVQLETSSNKEFINVNFNHEWPVVDLIKIPKVKRRLDIKAVLPVDYLSSSSDSEDDNRFTQTQQRPPSVTVPKAESDTSSSSESEDERGTKEENPQLQTSPNKSTVHFEEHSQFPVVDLVKIPKVKRHLDIKVAHPAVDSSASSDSEDERELVKENLQQAIFPSKEHVHFDQESQWPTVDLIKVPKLERRLDIKPVPSVVYSSSSSDSEDEKVNIKVTQVQERVPSVNIKTPKPESSSSSSSESEDETPHYTEKHDLKTQWPVLDLKYTTKLKRRLDIKVKTAPTESPSSSDSEDEKVNVKVTQVQERLPSTSIDVTKPKHDLTSSSDSEDEREVVKQNLQPIILPDKTPVCLDQESQWPVVDLIKVPKLKQRLDIKVVPTVVYSSSSSDSEDEKVNIKVTQVQEKKPSVSIKTPKPESGTSSSSESEDEREVIKQAIVPDKTPVHLDQESQWPTIDLVKIHKVKQRLDIKAALPAVDASSSSDSEEEKVKVTQVQETIVPSTNINVTKPDTSSSSESEDEREVVKHQESQWPAFDLMKIPKVKRRLDIKAVPSVVDSSSSSDSEDEKVKETIPVPSTNINVTKPKSDSSSSSDSEDEREVIKQNLQPILHPDKTPVHLDRESQWPALDLVKIPKVKRRLDIKTVPSVVYSSSSSDSEDEKVSIKVTQVQEKKPSVSIKSPKLESGTSSSSESEDEREVVKQTILPDKKPVHLDQESQWPAFDLIIPKVKRRLDFKATVVYASSSSDSEDEKVNVIVQERVPSVNKKAQKPKSGTSSSSESEDETPHYTEKHDLKTQWPVIDLKYTTKLKKRLDIKVKTAPTESRSSSDSEDEKVKVTQLQEKVPSANIIVAKPRSDSSSSSESDEETIQNEGVTGLGSQFVSNKVQTQWPVLDLGSVTTIKRRLDFKTTLPPPELPVGGSIHTKERSDSLSSSSSSDEEEEVVTKHNVTEHTSKWPEYSRSSSGIPQISRRLDIKGPSPKPDVEVLPSSESSSSSEDESKQEKAKLDNKDLIKVSIQSPLSIPRSPTTTPNIALKKYVVITDDMRTQSESNTPTPEVTPDLQTKWAKMNLGISRFRKRLDIQTRANEPVPPPLPLSLPPDSPTNKRDIKSSTLQRDSSSNSSEDEAVDMIVPDLSTGVPRIKRRLDIKAPTPPPSSASSSSEDETRYAHKFSDVTDQHSIEYKRTIMKTSPYSSYSVNTQRRSYTEPPMVQSDSRTPRKILSLDNIKRKLLPSKQTELPPNLRWTSVGSHLSEHPTPTPKRHHYGYSSSPPQLPKEDSSDSSSSDSEDNTQEMKKASIVTYSSYSPRGVTFSSEQILDRYYDTPGSPTVKPTTTSGDKSEKRGLSAIKAMSSERRSWDTEYTLTETSVDNIPQVHTVYRRTADVKAQPKMSQAQTYSTSSPSTDERRLADMLYGIPSFRRQVIKTTELPQGPPPPVPTTLPPDDDTVQTWRSPQSSLKQSRESLSLSKTKDESPQDDPYYDDPNISAV